MLAIYFLSLCALVAPSLQRYGPITNMNIVHSWNNLEYGFDSLDDYDYAIQNGIYIETGFKRPYDFANEKKTRNNRKPRIFLSSPRVVPGIPYTLAKISNQIGEYGPLLLPYPNFAAHSPSATPDCNRIISVFRIFTDPCNQLWAIDSGRDFYATPTLTCPPKILVFDLKTNTLIFKYVIPEGQYFTETSTHNGIILDIYDPPPQGRCRKGKAYVTDARGPSYLVFDLASRTSWMITNDLFKADPAYISATILGETFQFPDGLYTSTPYRKKNTVYLHAFASLYEIAAPLDVVNNKSLWENDPYANPDVFQPIGTRPTQSATQTKDSWGNIYSSLLDPPSIVSWNPNKPFSASKLKPVVQNNQTINFVAGLKVVRPRSGRECLMALTIPLQKLNLNTISINETNFYLMECRVNTLQKGRGSCIC